MSKSLPARPNLEQLKKQAKDLLRSYQTGDLSTEELVRKYHPDLTGKSATLSDAQLVIAREYGFGSWPKLKEHVESQNAAKDPMEELVRAVLASDAARAREALDQHPELKAWLNDAIPDAGFGRTLLLAAVQRTNKDLIDTLIKAGADINARSHWWAGGFGVLDDDRGLASFLIERGAVVDAHAAARLGMVDKLQQLLTANPALVHARGGDGQTPLHFASSIEIAELLLKHGAQIDALDIDHESTPAQYMLRERQPIARYLVARGCQTDLLMAAALGDLELARHHLDEDPNSIHMSVSEQYFPKKNPRSGGKIYIWTLGQHKTPHMVAREFGNEEVFRLLMDRSPEQLKLSQACELGDEELFRELLAKYPDLTQTMSDNDRRKVADAAQNNNTNAVRLMLQAGWPVNSRGQHAATALHWASFHGNPEMVKTILEYHPSLECADEDFHGTPVGWAIHGSEHGWHCRTGDYASALEELIRAGAKLPDKLGGTDAVQAVLRAFGLKE
jgi:ankyrin repeat protein